MLTRDNQVSYSLIEFPLALLFVLIHSCGDDKENHSSIPVNLILISR